MTLTSNLSPSFQAAKDVAARMNPIKDHDENHTSSPENHPLSHLTKMKKETMKEKKKKKKKLQMRRKTRNDL